MEWKRFWKTTCNTNKIYNNFEHDTFEQKKFEYNFEPKTLKRKNLKPVLYIKPVKFTNCKNVLCLVFHFYEYTIFLQRVDLFFCLNLSILVQVPI